MAGKNTIFHVSYHKFSSTIVKVSIHYLEEHRQGLSWDAEHNQGGQWGQQQGVGRQHANESRHAIGVAQATEDFHFVGDLADEGHALLEDFHGNLHALIATGNYGGETAVADFDVATVPKGDIEYW